MEILDLLNNHLLINALAAWAAAQVLKTILHAVTNKTLEWGRLIGDGGMPSGHSATVTSLAVTAGLEYGLESPLFAIAAVLAIVVMHDAMGIRQEAGKHAQALNELMSMLNNSSLETDVKLKEFLGHTPMQVVCGAILGLLIALILR